MGLGAAGVRLPADRQLAHGDVLLRRDGPDRQPGEQDPLHVRRSGRLPGDLSLLAPAAAWGSPPSTRRAPTRCGCTSPGSRSSCRRRPPMRKGLLKSAIRDNNPVVSFECSRLERGDGPGPRRRSPGAARRRRGEARRHRRDGGGPRLLRAGSAGGGRGRSPREGISVEVIDPRTLVPLDVETIRASVRKTGPRSSSSTRRLPTCSAASEIAALVVEDPATFRALKAPVQRVCAAPVPVPYSPTLEKAALPGSRAASRRRSGGSCDGLAPLRGAGLDGARAPTTRTLQRAQARPSLTDHRIRHTGEIAMPDDATCIKPG